MRESPAIRELVMRGFQLMAAKDIAGILAVWSNEPGAMFIGTDPGEWITDRATLEQMVRASVGNGSGSLPEDMEIRAYEEGTVGWANIHYTIKLPNGGRVQSRWTQIYHQEDGVWKAVDGHVSLGVPDNKILTFFQPG